MDRTHISRPGRWPLVRFAAADFAFNLYWQSVTLYLLYYYTEVAGLSIAFASLVFMLGSFWDGAVDIAAGIVADRAGVAGGRYRPWLVIGAAPLGLAFVLLYAVPAGLGTAGQALLLGGHLLFRTLYGLTNIPYAAMTARITADSAERAMIAGWRMLFGSLAAIATAAATLPLVMHLSAGGATRTGFLAMAILLAMAGTLLLVPIALRIDEGVLPATVRQSLRAHLRDCRRALQVNRALHWLLAAMAAATLAATVAGKATLYFYTYRIGDIAAGGGALTWMSVAGAAAIPLWMVLARRSGSRAVWFGAVAAALATTAVAAAAGIGTARSAQAYLALLQASLVGLNFAFWAMLPDTIEYAERRCGLRMEATVFGVAALTQKIALGVSVGLFGLMFDAIGFVAHRPQAQATQQAMEDLLLFVPAAAMLLSALCVARVARVPVRRDAAVRPDAA